MLIAITNADTKDYVSSQDPCKKLRKKMIPKDPDDLSKGEMEVARAPDEDPEWDIVEGATTFKLRGLDIYLTAAIYDGAQVIGRSDKDQEVRIHTNVNKTNVEAVKHGLVGFDNFTDERGLPIVFNTIKTIVNGREYDVVADATLNRLGIQLVQELGREIKAMSEVRPALQKN